MQSGEIVLLKELPLDRHVLNKSLRVTGHVTLLDFANHACQLEHAGSVLWVDIARVDTANVELRVSSLVQFIGEVRKVSDVGGDFSVPAEYGKVPFYLLAKVARVVDGLDMTLYEQALLARRAFLRLSSA